MHIDTKKQASQALTFHNISRTKNAPKLNIAILRNKEDEMVQNNAYLVKKNTWHLEHVDIQDYVIESYNKTSYEFSHFEVWNFLQFV